MVSGGGGGGSNKFGLRNQKAIIHGDQKSISIAAASILAKVYRDNGLTTFAPKAICR